MQWPIQLNFFFPVYSANSCLCIALGSVHRQANPRKNTGVPITILIPFFEMKHEMQVWHLRHYGWAFSNLNLTQGAMTTFITGTRLRRSHCSSHLSSPLVLVLPESYRFSFFLPGILFLSGPHPAAICLAPHSATSLHTWHFAPDKAHYPLTITFHNPSLQHKLCIRDYCS